MMRSRAALSIFSAALLKSGGCRGGVSAVAPARAMSSSSSASSAGGDTDTDTAAALHRPLRLLLLATLAGAAAAVLPQTFAPSPQAAVALLRADTCPPAQGEAQRQPRVAEEH